MLLHSPFFFFFFFHGCKLIIQTSCLYPLSTYTPHFFWKKKNPKIWESVYVLRQFGSCYVETSFYFIYFPFSFLRIIRNSRCGLTRHRFQRIQDCAQCPCLSLLIASRNHSLTPPPNTKKKKNRKIIKCLQTIDSRGVRYSLIQWAFFLDYVSSVYNRRPCQRTNCFVADIRRAACGGHSSFFFAISDRLIDLSEMMASFYAYDTSY